MTRRTLAMLVFVVPHVFDAQALELPRQNGNVTINGRLDEDIWREALRVELRYENNPGENIPAPVITSALLWEDGENLYIGFDARDPEPERIRAWLRDRDSLGTDDYVGVSLDTYNDGRRAFEFFANPLGVQLDRTRDDVNNNSDLAWDAVWESAGTISEHGYVVEMRIPLAQLQFQDVQGTQSWGYRLFRKYPRHRNVTISNISEDRSRNCTLCQYPQFTGFDGAVPARNLEIVPTLTALQATTNDMRGVQSVERREKTLDAGVEIRYAVTPEIIANLAINPDFSQIEADELQLDVNNRFTPAFPEQRPFFLEGADYFATPLQAVFTRTIVDPEVAGKITGKRGVDTFAAFAARDRVTNVLVPGATGSRQTVLERPNSVFVARYSRGLRHTSSLGAVLTVRDGEDYKNIVAGPDVHWRVNDHHEFTAQYLRSGTEYPSDIVAAYQQSAEGFAGHALFLQYSFETRDWFARIRVRDIDESFRADAGLMQQAAFAEHEYSITRKWQSDYAWWSRIRLRGAYETDERSDGQLIEEQYIAQLRIEGIWDSMLDLNLRSGREFDRGHLYDYDRLDLSARMTPADGFSLGLSTRVGDEIDVQNARLGTQWRFDPFMNWVVNRHLRLDLNSSRVELETQDGAEVFDADVLDARITWQFNLRSFLRLTYQKSDIRRNPESYVDDVDTLSRNAGRQLLYSWKMNPQTAFFIGYADTYVDENDPGTLAPTDRRWFLKISYGISI